MKRKVPLVDNPTKMLREGENMGTVTKEWEDAVTAPFYIGTNIKNS